MIEHGFTEKIRQVLVAHFGKAAEEIFEKATLLQYINLKTKAANRGSKSRGSFGSLYAVYVLVEDYIGKGFHKKGDYAKYEGAVFTSLFKRQRELPFGAKLQNHHLNSRMNEEFKKFFPSCQFVPIMRDPGTNRYWINTDLLLVKVGAKTYNIAEAVIGAIDAYVEAKRVSFNTFIEACGKLKDVMRASPDKVEAYILGLLAPNVDARLFEIVSFAILKYFYHDQFVYFGFTLEEIKKEQLKLFKTGRTNANDGGIDFVMRPLGRFFQVTETLDVKKYFLDIDKLERFPISFVIKSEEGVDELRGRLEQGARDAYGVDSVVGSYMACIEEIINVPRLRECFRAAVKQQYLPAILDEIVKQSKVEFNYSEETAAVGGDDDDDDDPEPVAG
ncbi:MAG: restriction endonuclease [Limisphaerales bacterium]